jgi:hypothetical protein
MKDWRAEIPDMIHRSIGMLAEARTSIVSSRRSIEMTRALIKASRDRMSGPLETVAESKK